MRFKFLILFYFLIAGITAQTHTFRCLESEIYARGCTTCDNVRTGKMITGIETTVDGKKTELLNPIVVKYDSVKAILIDYKNLTATLTLANTAYGTMTDLLKAIGKCTTPDGTAQYIDTLTFGSDTLGISLYGDSVGLKKVYIPSGADDQKLDTASYSSDTLYLSLENDGQAVKKIPIMGGSGSPKIDTFTITNDSLFISLLNDGELKKSVNLAPYKQTLSRSFDTIFISGGNYILLPVDINTDNQAFDTIRITNDTIFLSLEGDLIPVHKLNLKPYLDNTDSQYFDTCVVTNDTLFLSIFGDGQLRKAIDLTPYLTDSDQDLSFGTKVGALVPLNITSGSGVSITGSTYIDIERNSSSQITIKNLGDTLFTNEIQSVDTLTYSSDTLRISLSQDGQKYKSVYLPADTDDQSLSYGTKTGVTIPLNITGGSGVNLDQGTNIEITRDASNYITFKGNTTIDTFSYGSDTIKISLTNDGQSTKKIYVPQITDTDDQYVDTFDISGNNLRISLQGDNQALKTVSLSPYLDNTDSQVIDTMDIYGGVFLRTSLSGDGQAAKLVDLTNFYNLLTVQNKSGNTIPLRSSTVTTDLSVTEGDNITLTKNGTYQFTIDSRPTIDTFSYSSDTLRVSINGDQQKYKTVYIPQGADDQFIDTLSIVSNNLRLSLDGDGRAYSSVSLSPYLDNTDSQTLSITAGKGTISISGGNSIQLGDSSATNEIQTIDTFSISSNTLRASLSSDGQAFKTVDLSPYLDNTDSQVIDTFSFSSDTLRVSISGDGQKYKTVYIPGVTDTDDQNLSFATKSGSTNILNISDGAGVNILDGTGINISRDASNQITVNNTGDLSTTNEIQTVDTFEINSNNLRLSLLNDGQLYKTVSLSPYLDNTDAQQVDTFSYSLDTLRLSIAGDGQKYKTIYLPNITDTDDQYIDTFRVNSGNVELSLNGDGQAVSTVAVTSIAPVQAVSAGTGISVSGTSTITVTNTGDLSNTNEIQTIDTFEINSNTLRASLSGDGQAFKTVSLSPYLDNTDSQVVDTFSYSSDTLRLSVSGDGQKYKTIYLPNVADTDDQTLSITAGKGTISISEGNSIQLADSSATNEAWTIDGDDADTEVISNQTVKFEGAGIITTDYVPASDKIILTGTEVDGSITNEGILGVGAGASNTSIITSNTSTANGVTITAAGINTISESTSSNGGTITITATEVDGSTTNEIQTIDTLTHSSDTLRISLSSDGQRYKAVYVPTGADDQTIDTFQLSSNTLRLSLEADGQAFKTVDLSKYVDTTFAQNGTRISNDSLYWGSQSSSTDNGSTLIHDTYIWQGGNDITFFNNGDGPDKPTLYLSAVNDVWIGANSTSTAGTAGTAGKPSVYLRYGSSGAYSFGVNNASNLNALGAGAVNFGINGLASGASSKNFSDDGIASSTHSINMGRSGEAKTDSYAWNSGAFGSAANFAAWNSGYDGDATNYYSFNSARVGLASGYSSVNMGQSGVSSGADAKNFGNGGQVSGDHAIGFSKFNVTSGNYGMNGSYYTESHAFGQSRWGYFGTDHNSQSASGWVADNILFAIDNGKEDTVRSSALTASARGWFQLRDIGTTQTNITSAKQAPKAALEVVSTESGFIPPGGTLAQRNAIWNEGGQTGNFTPTYTKGWQSISGSNIMDQNGLQFQVMNEYGGTSLYALRYNGSGYYWHQIY